MAATTFHQFHQLPKELRDEIWQAAIRPSDRLGAYFFTIFRNQGIGRELFGRYCAKGSSGWDLVFGNAVAAPKRLSECGKSEDCELSWTVDNPSAYMIDSGLWTACKESREVMSRHFRPSFWALKQKEYYDKMSTGVVKWDDWWSAVPDGPVTAWFEAEDDHRSLTIWPTSDLIILQPLEGLPPITWEHISEETNVLAYFHGTGVNHVAFDLRGDSAFRLDKYSESFLDFERSYPFCDFLKQIVRYPVASYVWKELWLIDGDLKRLPGATSIPDGDESRRIFYGNGCRFVEYKSTDCGWTTPWAEKALSRAIMDAKSFEMWEHWTYGTPKLKKLINVLACEVLDIKDNGNVFADPTEQKSACWKAWSRGRSRGG